MFAEQTAAGAHPTERRIAAARAGRRRLRFALGALPAALLLLAAPAFAHAAGETPPAPTALTPALSAQASQLTGTPADQLGYRRACSAYTPGRAQCDALELIDTATRRVVHPRLFAHAAGAATLTPALAASGVSATSLQAAQAPPAPGTPAYLQQAYDLTYLSQTKGAGDTVAVIDAYDDPDAEADLAVYRQAYGLPACATANGCFTKLDENGQPAPLPSPSPAIDDWSAETSLDLDAVSALCPNCAIMLVEADTDTPADLDAAIISAARLGARQISNSWGVASQTPIAGTYEFPGVSVLAASGDYGSYGDAAYQNYPAALPGVVAVGGTTLAPTANAGARGLDEYAWDSGWQAAGSGCNEQEPKPAYQTDTGCGGRAYSDVSADANPANGLKVYDSADGSGWTMTGGTSLATALTAAFEAVSGQRDDTPRWAYADKALLNASTGSYVPGNWLFDPSGCPAQIAYICTGGPGYGGATGTGSISGAIATGAPGIGAPSVPAPAGAYTYTEAASASALTLLGGVYPNGLDSTYWVQYGTTTSYGRQTATGDLGVWSGAVSITNWLTGLAPSTTYHYRLVASNAAGTTYGYDYSATTQPGPPRISGAPRIAPARARVGAVLRETPAPVSGAAVSVTQWMRCATACVAVGAADAAAYTPSGADAGQTMYVRQTATDAAGATVSWSAPVRPVSSPSAGSARLAGAPVAVRGATGRPLATARLQTARTHGRLRRTVALHSAARLNASRRRRRAQLEAWACPVNSKPDAAPTPCTAPVAFTARATVTLPALLRGPVRVVVVSAGR